MSAFTTKGPWVLTGRDSGRIVSSLGEDGTANSRSNNNSTNVSYSKMNMHYSGRTYLSALHMHIRVRVRVIWGGKRFVSMPTSTTTRHSQFTYLNLLLFRGSPSWFSGREADKRQPAARPTPPSDRDAPRATSRPCQQLSLASPASSRARLRGSIGMAIRYGAWPGANRGVAPARGWRQQPKSEAARPQTRQLAHSRNIQH